MVAPQEGHLPDPLSESVGVIGSGIAGLITAHTLLRDGFKYVDIITRDDSVGGVWSKERVYPGLQINSVHGEFRFSSMQMREPDGSSRTGGRLTGEHVQQYMESFAKHNLDGKIRFDTDVVNIRRGDRQRGWDIRVRDQVTSEERIFHYARIVVCTGGCSNPRFPKGLTPADAKASGFTNPILHSMNFRSRIDDLLSSVKPISFGETPSSSIIVIGGGKSAQDAASYLAREGRPVAVVFDVTDSFLASPNPVPQCLRKSRVLSIMSPHIELRTRLERFLHTTRLGAIVVYCFWNVLSWLSLWSLGVPRGSPLRRSHSFFWNTRTNDEGVPRPGSFHSLVNTGKIKLLAPARIARFGDDGQSVILDDGRVIPAAAVVLGTGYESSWKPIFNEETMEYLGLGQHPPETNKKYHWDYTSLANPPEPPRQAPQAASFYRGLVPVKSIPNRDFAVNGAVFSIHHAYLCEASAHWIAAYFRHDELKLPRGVDAALEEAEREAAWVRQRYPHVLHWINESHTASIAFWTWPQLVDELLSDMGLPGMRSGGNWLTWPFKVIDLAELATLKEERDAKRGK
ncbi:FAD/NAD-P-binding domain-containing protein [Gloeopeniophorella convolvens]|nr:FAD/NAD-P-binding domain-containing protein [Gloeopeniophorella convolvens]